jgi:ATP-dependent Clp protease protease subunit
MMCGGKLENVVWVTDFDDDAFREFYETFSQLEMDPKVDMIPVIISSFGGEVYSMLAMRDMIKSCNKPVATIALGKAMSCGASLLAAGTKGLRFASPDTHILIHEVSGGGLGKNTDLKGVAKETDRLNKKLFHNLAVDTDRPIDFFIKKMKDLGNADWYLSVEEAKKIGIIDCTDIPRVAFGAPIITLIRNRKQEMDKERAPKDKSKPKSKDGPKKRK